MTELRVSTQRQINASLDAIWSIVDNTARYADWVEGVLEVTSDCGTATVGGEYAERNRTIGPLTTASQWTIIKREAKTLRVDRGEGFQPLHGMVNTFRFTEVGDDAAMMVYEVQARIGLGPLGKLIAPILRRTLTAEFQRSMQRLETVARSESASGLIGGESGTL